MTDKVGLISIALNKNDTTMKSKENSSEITASFSQTSSNFVQSSDSAVNKSNQDETSSASAVLSGTNNKPEIEGSKKKLKEQDGSSSTGPNFYQKFVSSFDAVFQNLTFKEEPVKQILSSFDLEGIAAYIKEEQPKNVIFMVGAGISTSAGIPDFRTPGTGLYDNLAKFNLPDPQAVFDINFFKLNPEPFYILARDLFHDDVKPTLCHHFIRLFEEKKILRRCFTQNIDTLEYAAGLPEDRIITAHGSHQSSTCQNSKCKKKYSKKWFADRLRDKDSVVAKCEACKNVVKPDIVFFGEKLPNRFFSAALADFPKCDLLIIMGTSLVVQPFAFLLQQVAKDVPRLLINLMPAGQDNCCGNVYGSGDSGLLKYGEQDNIRDVFWQGTCDDGSLKLARLLGWEQELLHMASKSSSQ